MDEKKSLPSTLIVVLSLLGLYTATKGLAPYSSSGDANARPPVPAVSSDPNIGEPKTVEEEDVTILRPLLDATLGESPQERPKSRCELFDKILRSPGGRRRIHCLVATIPDPVRTSNSFRFDQLLDAIERAAETKSYILDRWGLPWADRARLQSTTASAKVAGASAEVQFASDAKGEPQPMKPALGVPGVLVFRGKPDATKAARGPSPLLILLIVPESPTLGLDIRAMERALELAEAIETEFDESEIHAPRSDPWVARILGPNFSGVQPSMERALLSWLTTRAERGGEKVRPCRVEILSGGASSIDKSRLCGLENGNERGLVDRLDRETRKSALGVDFHATIHPGPQLLRAVMDYLDELGEGPVAILNESNTGGGSSAASTLKGTKDREITFFPYPMHIAEIRRSYEKQGLLRGGAAQAIRAAGHLATEDDVSSAMRDVVPDHTRGLTSQTENQVLTQTMTNIARQGFSKVGIIATDPRDTVFLARLLRQYCPDAQIFTSSAELLYTNPATISDLRGMLIGSTYPLYLPNQAWSFPFRSRRSSSMRAFPSQIAQGVFNAAVAHLEEMIPSTIGPGPEFQEYGPPLARPADPGTVPPVWISIVGERGLFPLKAEPVRPVIAKDGRLSKDNYIYTNRHFKAATPADSIPFTPHVGWSYLFWGSTVACVILGVMTYLHLEIDRLDPGARPAIPQGEWKRPVLEVLGWTRMGKGPGWNLPLALVAALIAYTVVAWPVAMDFLPGSFLLWVETLAITTVLAVGLASVAPLHSMRVVALTGAAAAIATLILVRGTAYLLRDPGPLPGEVGGSLTLVAGGPAAMLATSALSAALTTTLAVMARRRMVQVPPAGLAKWLERPWSALRRVRGWVPTWLGSIEMLAALGGIVLACAATLTLVIAIQVIRSHSSASYLHIFLARERTTALTGGVTPIFPTLFLAIGFLAWAATRTRRRHLIDTYAPQAIEVPEGVDDSDTDPTSAMKSIQGRIEDRFRGSWSLDRFHLFPVVALLLFDLGALALVGPIPWSVEGPAFDVMYRLAFAALFIQMTYRLMRLAVAWGDIRRLLRVITQLPMVRAFDRLSPRVSAWLFDPPRPGGHRRRTILRQAEVVRETMNKPPFREAWHSAYQPDGWTDDEWTKLELDFDTLHESDRSIASYDRLLTSLRRHWYGRPLGRTHPNTPRDARADESVANWAPPWLRARVRERVTAVDPVVVDLRLEMLRDWAEMAEDLIALQIVRWLGAAMAQVWASIAFLVVGSLAMLLAVSSYPFPMQGRLLGIVGMVIAAVVAVVLSVVVGTNTDEVISRVKNTRPGLTPDATMLGHLATFVVPLLGVLAAISFDMSDLLRSWLDPIFRIFT